MHGAHFWVYLVYSSASPKGWSFLLERVEEVPELQSCVVLTPSTSAANLFPSLAASTRVREQRDPNQDCKCGLLSFGLHLLRGPSKAKEKKTQPAAQRSSCTALFLQRSQPRPPPLRKSQHDVYTTKLLLWFRSLSKYLGYKVWMFSRRGRIRTGPSIMAFSEMAPQLPQKAMPSTDVAGYNYTNQDTLSERQPPRRAGCRGFGGEALGNIRFGQLSPPHLRYLNISGHEHTRRAEAAWPARAVAGLIAGVTSRLPPSRRRAAARFEPVSSTGNKGAAAL